MIRLPHAPLCIALSFALTGPLHAATLPDTTVIAPVMAAAAATTLDRITVTGDHARALTPDAASLARSDLERTAGGVAQVDAAQLRGRSATTLKDVLGYVPGVFAQPKFGEDVKLSIRGSGLSRNFHLRGVQLLVDGIPLTLADGSGDFQEIDPLTIDYVQVYKGANGLQYGGGALGGAIVFTGRTGASAPGFGLRVDGGSFGQQRSQASYGLNGERGDGYIAASYLRGDGFRDHGRQDSARLSGNLGWCLADGIETRFYVNRNAIRQELPGALGRDDALHAPRTANPAAIAGDQARDIRSTRLGNRTRWLLRAGVLDVGAYALNKRLHHPIFQVLDNDTDGVGAFVRWQGDNGFTAGINLAQDATDARRFVNLGGRRGAATLDQLETARNLEAYAEQRFAIADALELIVGTKAQRARRDVRDRFLANGADDASRSYTGVSPRLGLLWQADADTQWFANLSRGYEAPTFSDLNPSAAPGFADLAAQTATTLELGGRGRVGALHWDAAAYRMQLRNEIQIFTNPAGGTLTTNADRSVHQGVEVGLSAALANIAGGTLQPRVAYTFNDFRFDDDATYADNQLPGAPRHVLNGELMWHHDSGFHVGPTLEWQPEAYYIDNANTLKTRAFALVGMRAGWERADGDLRVFIDARNLADRGYIGSVSVLPVATDANATLFNPGDGRAVFVGVEWRL